MALPPPRPNGLPGRLPPLAFKKTLPDNINLELPTKPFCPILTRSMIDLNSEVAELHSRCSRANCKYIILNKIFHISSQAHCYSHILLLGDRVLC